MRPADCLHSLAKSRGRPAFSSAAKEQPSYDSSKEREWDRLWNHWFQREERSDLSHVSQVAEVFCGQARCGDQLGAYLRVARQFEPIQVARRARVCQEDARANAEHFRPHLVRN